MYPFPVKGQLTIVLNNIAEDDIYKDRLYTMQGRIVKIFELKSSINVISIEELNSGIYMLKINADRSYSKTFVIE